MNPLEYRRETFNFKKSKNTKLMQNLVRKDRQVTINEIANEVGISRGSGFPILLEDIRLSKHSGVLRALQENQMIQKADLSLVPFNKYRSKLGFS